MGEAMLKGWLESGELEPGQVSVCDRDAGKRGDVAERYGITQGEENRKAVEEADVCVMAVKPQDSDGVLDELTGALDRDKVLMSVVAGLTIETVRKKVGAEPSVVRVMPNMAASVQAAVSAFSLDPGPGGIDKGKVIGLLEAFGDAVEVEEGWMDTVTAISGSGPAYFFLLVELLEKEGVELGLPLEVSRKLARETLWGAARVLKMTGRGASELREAVSSPGGTTVAAISEMEDMGIRKAVERGVEAARKRANELSC